MFRHRKDVSAPPPIVYLLAGIAGGAAGLAYALIVLGGDSTFVPPWSVYGPPTAGVISIAAGVLIGWFLAALAYSWSRGHERCPRCGTPNKGNATSCRACSLPFS
jgi:hypothetical protein